MFRVMMFVVSMSLALPVFATGLDEINVTTRTVAVKVNHWRTKISAEVTGESVEIMLDFKNWTTDEYPEYRRIDGANQRVLENKITEILDEFYNRRCIKVNVLKEPK